MIQLSQPHMTTGKAIDLTIWNFVSKVMSLLFNMLSRFFAAFLPRRKSFSMAAVTVCSDIGGKESSLSLFPLFSNYRYEVTSVKY